MNNTILWEEKISTEPEANYLHNNAVVPSDITPNIKSKLIENQCKNTGKEKKKIKEMTRDEFLSYKKIIQNRYYAKNKDKIKLKLTSGCWKKNCPICRKEQVYTYKNNFFRALKHNWMCLNCVQKTSEYKEKLSKSKIGISNINRRKRPFESIYNGLLRTAKKRDIKCSLTYEDFIEFTKINNCHYCNAIIEWQPHQLNNNTRKVGTNLDRIDSNIGYDISNCCVCCKICNSVKNIYFSYKEMLEIGKTIKILRERKYNGTN